MTALQPHIPVLLNEVIAYLEYVSPEVAAQDSTAAFLLKLCVQALEAKRDCSARWNCCCAGARPL